jgi:hypothetical protein
VQVAFANTGHAINSFGEFMDQGLLQEDACK